MLGVLKFKSAMFEGVLDGGESNVFPGDGKMKRFMETVEKVSESIPIQEPTAGVEETEMRMDEVEVDERETGGPGAHQEQVWNEVLSAGLHFLGKIAQATQERKSNTGGENLGGPFNNLIRPNEKTGAPEVHIPLPDGVTVEKLGDLLTGFGQMFKALGNKRP